MVSYHQSLALDGPYLSCNDHCNWCLFQEIFFYYYSQKQWYADVLQNRCYLKLCNIHRKTFLLQSLFDKVAGLMVCNFISTSFRKRLQRRCFPVKIAKFLRTPFYRTPPVAAFVSLKK